ncbi:hypothetical protein WJX72_001731 [[Myrmecia] bisecta]|uniref:Uncharacterized protein n=1 Tax=[Myrmecia] bisecta TaxID=41462 RepID=A0AAW1R5N4_9CHLO
MSDLAPDSLVPAWWRYWRSGMPYLVARGMPQTTTEQPDSQAGRADADADPELPVGWESWRPGMPRLQTPLPATENMPGGTVAGNGANSAWQVLYDFDLEFGEGTIDPTAA